MIQTTLPLTNYITSCLIKTVNLTLYLSLNWPVNKYFPLPDGNDTYLAPIDHEIRLTTVDLDVWPYQ